MSREPENECPECGEWKGEDFELCRGCAEEAKENREAPVVVSYDARVGESPKALLYRMTPGFMGTKLWIPKSQIVSEDADAKTLVVARWWAEDNGLAYQDE